MYIDPGVTAIIAQIAIGLALAIPIFLKLYWAKIKRLVRRDPNKNT